MEAFPGTKLEQHRHLPPVECLPGARYGGRSHSTCGNVFNSWNDYLGLATLITKAVRPGKGFGAEPPSVVVAAAVPPAEEEEEEEEEAARGARRKRRGGAGAPRERDGERRQRDGERRVRELTAHNERLRAEIQRLSAEVQRTRAALIDRIVNLRQV